MYGLRRGQLQRVEIEEDREREEAEERATATERVRKQNDLNRLVAGQQTDLIAAIGDGLAGGEVGGTIAGLVLDDCD